MHQAGSEGMQGRGERMSNICTSSCHIRFSSRTDACRKILDTINIMYVVKYVLFIGMSVLSRTIGSESHSAPPEYFKWCCVMYEQVVV